MPLYEYVCTDCGHRFEVLQRIGEGSKGVRCPECDSEQVERQLSTFAAGAGSGSSRSSGASCGPGGFT